MQNNTALDIFINSYLQAHGEAGKRLEIDYDEAWPSACYQNVSEHSQLVEWKPILRSPCGDMSALESALDTQMNPQLKRYYGRYWSDNLNAKTPRGGLQLLQPWNQADFERLQQNLIGHILMKRRLKQPDTWFFAVTDEEDYIISVEGKTGHVVLEQVGLLPQETLASDLEGFLSMLTPVVD